MPDQSLPRWGRIALRAFGLLAYFGMTLVGLVGLLWPANPDLGTTGVLLLHGAGGFLAVSAFTCFMAVCLFRWRLEFMFVWWVCAGLSAYVGLAASVRPPTSVTYLIAALAFVLCMTIVSRGISLAIFASRTRQYKKV